MLISDPVVSNMNPTRWAFEAWQVRMEDEEKINVITQVAKAGVKAFTSVLVSVLGLNLEPIAEPDPAKPDETIYRFPREGEFTPLIFAVSRRDYLAQAFEKLKNLIEPDVRTGSIDTPLDEMSEEDLLFFDEIAPDEKKAFWNSLEMQMQRDAYVIQEDPKNLDPLAVKQPVPKGVDPDRLKAYLEETNTTFGARGAKKRTGLTIEEDDIPELGKK